MIFEHISRLTNEIQSTLHHNKIRNSSKLRKFSLNQRNQSKPQTFGHFLIQQTSHILLPIPPPKCTFQSKSFHSNFTNRLVNVAPHFNRQLIHSSRSQWRKSSRRFSALNMSHFMSLPSKLSNKRLDTRHFKINKYFKIYKNRFSTLSFAEKHINFYCNLFCEQLHCKAIVLISESD
jgi:hypothetical protein